MKIGHDENFLSIEPNDETDHFAGYAIAAGCGSGDSVFSGSNGTVHFDQSAESEKSFQDFEALRVDETSIGLTENCSIHLTRLSRGDIQVHFQICRYRYDAKFYGRITVEGEHSIGFLRNLGHLAY